MAKLSSQEFENFSGGASSNNFFKLADHGDKAIVRFMHEGLDDISKYAIHDIKVDGRDREVGCLKAPGQPSSTCPLCACGKDGISNPSAKLYLELLVYETDKQGNPTGNTSLQIWERGKTWSQKLISLCNRYKPLCDYVFEIERIGKKGSRETTYEVYPMANATAEEFPFQLSEEPYDPLGKIILDKNFDELNYYLENGYQFPPEEKEENVVRRGTASQPVENTQPARRDAAPVNESQPQNNFSRARRI